MIRRKGSWRSALVKEIERWRRTPFAWGTHDCGLFAAACVEAMTGEDFSAPFRGRYHTAGGAARALRKAGHESVVSLAASLFPEIHPSKARAGDLAAISTAEGEALGVVTGPEIAVYAHNGIGAVPLGLAVRAFKVPTTAEVD